MTRKRYIKLKMSEGLSRNEAVQNAREIVAEGISYQEDYDHDAQCPSFTAKQCAQIGEPLAAGLISGMSTVFTAISNVFENAAKAVNQAAETIRKMEPALISSEIRRILDNE